MGSTRLPKCLAFLIRLAAVAALVAVPTGIVFHATPAAAQVSVSVDFRTALEPYGAFRRVARWGEVWIPNDVPQDWRPYTVGHWVYSGDYGWYWVSAGDEAPWGWIVFHYGRWVWLDDIGWAWVPGDQWGPAWVDWRRGDSYVGWAPLPPDEIAFEVRDEPQYWIFVRPRDLLAPRIATVFVEPEPTILRETVVVNETVIVRDRGFAVDPGIEPAFVAALTGRSIPEYRVQPRVLAGTAHPASVIEVHADELRSNDFRRRLTQETNIRETSTTIRATTNVPPPQPLGRNEHGRLGQNPPRAVSDLAPQGGHEANQPGNAGQARTQPTERNAIGNEPQTGRNAAGTGRHVDEGSLNQRGPNQRGNTATQEINRDLHPRGANAATGKVPTNPPAQQLERNATGRTPERGLSEHAPTGNPATHKEPTRQTDRRLKQPGETERNATGPTAGTERGRGVYNRATPEEERGLNRRGAMRVLPPGEQRGEGERGLNDRRTAGPTPSEHTRWLYNRVPSGRQALSAVCRTVVFKIVVQLDLRASTSMA